MKKNNFIIFFIMLCAVAIVLSFLFLYRPNKINVSDVERACIEIERGLVSKKLTKDQIVKLVELFNKSDYINEPDEDIDVPILNQYDYTVYIDLKNGDKIYIYDYHFSSLDYIVFHINKDGKPKDIFYISSEDFDTYVCNLRAESRGWPYLLSRLV